MLRIPRIRLNRWQRLWVLASVVYLAVVGGAVSLLWPTDRSMVHRAEYLERMPPEFRSYVIAAYASELAAERDGSGGVRYLVPNGAILILRGGRLAAARAKYPEYNDLSDRELATRLAARSPEYRDLTKPQVLFDDEAAKVRQAYYEILDADMKARRLSYIKFGMLAWLVPSVTAYGLGWARAWASRRVNRGGDLTDVLSPEP